MTQINQLTAVSAIADGDLVPVWSTANGGPRTISASGLAAYVNGSAIGSGTGTQFAAPSATLFNVAVSDGSIWLVLTPTAGFANGTITLPANPADGDELLCNTTQAVTALIIDGNGKTVTGEPTTLAADAFFRLRFEGVTGTWYRVG